MTSHRIPDIHGAAPLPGASGTGNSEVRRSHNPVIQDWLTFVETSQESRGRWSRLEIDLAPGGGNGLHVHRSFTERFEVVEGEIGVQLGRDRHRLGPGQDLQVPAGVPHRFFNATDTRARFRVELTPGHDGFEDTLRIAYGLAADGLTDARGMPRHPTHLALLMEMGDTTVAGPAALLVPLFRRIARRARARGVEAELVRRYCGPWSPLP
jgi:quercetin dioxygenase-like cupin family protein